MNNNVLCRFSNDANVRKWLQECGVQKFAQVEILYRIGASFTQALNNLKVVASTNGYLLTNKQVRDTDGTYVYEVTIGELYSNLPDKAAPVQRLALADNEEDASSQAMQSILEAARIVVEDEIKVLALKKRKRAEGMHNEHKMSKLLREADELDDAGRKVAARGRHHRADYDSRDSSSSCSDDDDDDDDSHPLDARTFYDYYFDQGRDASLGNAPAMPVDGGIAMTETSRQPQREASPSSDKEIAALREKVRAAAAAAEAAGGDDLDSEEENTVPALCRRSGSSTHKPPPASSSTPVPPPLPPLPIGDPLVPPLPVLPPPTADGSFAPTPVPPPLPAMMSPHKTSVHRRAPPVPPLPDVRAPAAAAADR